MKVENWAEHYILFTGEISARGVYKNFNFNALVQVVVLVFFRLHWPCGILIFFRPPPLRKESNGSPPHPPPLQASEKNKTNQPISVFVFVVFFYLAIGRESEITRRTIIFNHSTFPAEERASHGPVMYNTFHFCGRLGRGKGLLAHNS